jgi:hypothetical protein
LGKLARLTSRSRNHGAIEVPEWRSLEGGLTLGGGGMRDAAVVQFPVTVGVWAIFVLLFVKLK